MCTTKDELKAFCLNEQNKMDDRIDQVKLYLQEHPSNVCVFCNKKLGSKSSLMVHTKTIHLGQKRFKCEKCDPIRRFSKKQHLELHMDSLHSDVRRYQCQKCEFRFKEQKHLARHLKSDHKHACKFCTRTFLRKTGQGGLAPHIESAHPEQAAEISRQKKRTLRRGRTTIKTEPRDEPKSAKHLKIEIPKETPTRVKREPLDFEVLPSPQHYAVINPKSSDNKSFSCEMKQDVTSQPPYSWTTGVDPFCNLDEECPSMYSSDISFEDFCLLSPILTTPKQSRCEEKQQTQKNFEMDCSDPHQARDPHISEPFQPSDSSHNNSPPNSPRIMGGAASLFKLAGSCQTPLQSPPPLTLRVSPRFDFKGHTDNGRPVYWPYLDFEFVDNNFSEESMQMEF